MNPGIGDLHLRREAQAAINKAPVLTEVAGDYDRNRRPKGAAADIGADEFTRSPGSLPAPNPRLDVQDADVDPASGDGVIQSAAFGSFVAGQMANDKLANDLNNHFSVQVEGAVKSSSAPKVHCHSKRCYRRHRRWLREVI